MLIIDSSFRSLDLIIDQSPDFLKLVKLYSLTGFKRLEKSKGFSIVFCLFN
ncbi:protein of unknown function [Mycoplasma capricolum subsp. capripneumoniae]|nr:protein of unknown function [Mycoplasma capricolum subsp. capripneumoniae]